MCRSLYTRCNYRQFPAARKAGSSLRMDLGAPTHPLGGREKEGEAAVALAAGGLGWPAYVKGPCPQSRMSSALGTSAWFCAGPAMVCLENVGSLQSLTLDKAEAGRVFHGRL